VFPVATWREVKVGSEEERAEEMAHDLLPPEE